MSRDDIDLFDLRLLALYELVLARESHHEPVTRRFLAIRAIRKALLSEHPTLAMGIEARKPARVANELLKARVKPILAELAARYGVDVDIITLPNKSADVMAIKNAARWTLLKHGFAPVDASRILGCAIHQVTRGAAKHQRLVDAAAVGSKRKARARGR